MDYIGALAPKQVVKIRFGRLSRYASENPAPYNHEKAEGALAHGGGAGHQEWNHADYPYGGVIGTTGSNIYWDAPWQAMWIPTTEYIDLPNVFEVKKDKKMESDGIGGIESVTVEIENILYPATVGGSHYVERGAMSPLRGYYAHGDEGAPDLPQLLDELAAAVAANEWSGRFAFAAQITIFQGYGELIKTFTGLIEDIDTTSRPDRITLTARDFGLLFTETHFLGWGKDPIIQSPVYFIDAEHAAKLSDQGYNASASSEAAAKAHEPKNVLDFDLSTFWKSLPREEDETEYVDIALPEGKYRFTDVLTKIAGMDVYISLRPAEITPGDHPRRRSTGEVVEVLTTANKRLDKNGWVDLGFILKGEPETQLVPGAHGGNSYTNHFAEYPTGDQRSPIEPIEIGETVPPIYEVGANSILRLSFRKLHKEAGKYFAEVTEFHGVRQAELEGAAKAEWISTDDISDVIRTLCIWAGFKEWDIEDTGSKLPVPIIAYKGEAYMDVIKKVCDGIGWNFYMKDPTPDGEPFAGASIEDMGGSLGVPTFKRPLAVEDDSLAGTEVVSNETFTGDLPTVKDRDLIETIDVKQTNEPLYFIIRVYGRTKSQPGDQEAAIESGKLIAYTLRPPWSGTPPTYSDTRLGGVLKQAVHYDSLLSTPEDVRNAAILIALQEALLSITATIEVPFIRARKKAPAKLQPPDLEDHILLMDLGAGVTSRLAILGRSSTFIAGEQASFTVTFEGALIDTPDVRGIVNIINGIAAPNGEFMEWANTTTPEASEAGYG